MSYYLADCRRCPSVFPARRWRPRVKNLNRRMWNGKRRISPVERLIFSIRKGRGQQQRQPADHWPLFVIAVIDDGISYNSFTAVPPTRRGGPRIFLPPLLYLLVFNSIRGKSQLIRPPVWARHKEIRILPPPPPRFLVHFLSDYYTRLCHL